MNVPETFFSVSEEIVLFGLSFIFGIIIGICYDVFRTARILFPHNTVLVVIEDVVFMAGYAVFLSSFSSAAARGELRFYYVIGNAIGFIVYFFTVGSIVICTMKKIYFALKKLTEIILKPFKSVYVLLYTKADNKFVGNPENSVKRNKKNPFLLLNKTDLMYNKKENKKRKNVKNVDKEAKTKDKEKKPV